MYCTRLSTRSPVGFCCARDLRTGSRRARVQRALQKGTKAVLKSSAAASAGWWLKHSQHQRARSGRGLCPPRTPALPACGPTLCVPAHVPKASVGERVVLSPLLMDKLRLNPNLLKLQLGYWCQGIAPIYTGTELGAQVDNYLFFFNLFFEKETDFAVESFLSQFQVLARGRANAD